MPEGLVVRLLPVPTSKTVLIATSSEVTPEIWQVYVQGDGHQEVQLGTWRCDQREAERRMHTLIEWGST